MTPKPAIFDPANAPPGVQLKFISFWQKRDLITPRLLLVHTNAATKEGSIDSAYNWANQEGSNHTIPHYQVDRQDNGSGFIARKLLPTNRKGIANQTAPSVEGYSTYGSVQKFSLAIETADLGFPTPGATVGFTAAQAEMIARIIAYESIVWKFPIALPDSWHGTGVASHTDPYGYPMWTIAAGKTCPGDAKKKQVREQIIPRANAIRKEWTAPAPAPKPPTPKPPTARIVTVQTALAGFPVLKPGATGQWVKVLQSVLNVSGAGLTESGTFDAKTQNVVKFCQGANGLPLTGIVDMATWAVCFPKAA